MTEQEMARLKRENRLLRKACEADLKIHDRYCDRVGCPKDDSFDARVIAARLQLGEPLPSLSTPTTVIYRSSASPAIGVTW